MPRNQPPHFKVRLSLANHAKTAGVFRDDHLLAWYIRLGLLGIERYADRTDDTFTITIEDAIRVTGRTKPKHARLALDSLASASPLEIEWDASDDRVGRVRFRNFAKKQFPFRDRVGGGTPTASRSKTPPPLPPPQEEEKTEEKSERRHPKRIQNALNGLAAETGTEEEKLRFIESDLGIVESDAREKKRSFQGMLLRYYRTWRRNPDGPIGTSRRGSGRIASRQQELIDSRDVNRPWKDRSDREK